MSTDTRRREAQRARAQGDPIPDLIQRSRQAGPDALYARHVLARLEERAGEKPSQRQVWTYLDEKDWSAGGVTNRVIRLQHEQTGMAFCVIPSGSFLMGSPEDEEGRYQDEGPQHLVTFAKPYLMAQTHVTQAVWERVMGSNPSRFQGESDSPERPVEQVSWHDCQEFCRRTGLRLPSESEWERACRAGTTTPYFFGETPEDLHRFAWFWDNSERRTHPVGQKLPNGFGLYDVIGGVWEWREDEWRANYEGAPTDGSAWTTEWEEQQQQSAKTSGRIESCHQDQNTPRSDASAESAARSGRTRVTSQSEPDSSLALAPNALNAEPVSGERTTSDSARIQNGSPGGGRVGGEPLLIKPGLPGESGTGQVQRNLQSTGVTTTQPRDWPETGGQPAGPATTSGLRGRLSPTPLRPGPLRDPSGARSAAPSLGSGETGSRLSRPTTAAAMPESTGSTSSGSASSATPQSSRSDPTGQPGARVPPGTGGQGQGSGSAKAVASETGASASGPQTDRPDPTRAARAAEHAKGSGTTSDRPSDPGLLPTGHFAELVSAPLAGQQVTLHGFDQHGTRVTEHVTLDGTRPAVTQGAFGSDFTSGPRARAASHSEGQTPTSTPQPDDQQPGVEAGIPRTTRDSVQPVEERSPDPTREWEGDRAPCVEGTGPTRTASGSGPDTARSGPTSATRSDIAVSGPWPSRPDPHGSGVGASGEARSLDSEPSTEAPPGSGLYPRRPHGVVLGSGQECEERPDPIGSPVECALPARRERESSPSAGQGSPFLAAATDLAGSDPSGDRSDPSLLERFADPPGGAGPRVSGASTAAGQGPSGASGTSTSKDSAQPVERPDPTDDLATESSEALGERTGATPASPSVTPGSETTTWGTISTGSGLPAESRSDPTVLGGARDTGQPAERSSDLRSASTQSEAPQTLASAPEGELTRGPLTPWTGYADRSDPTRTGKSAAEHAPLTNGSTCSGPAQGTQTPKATRSQTSGRSASALPPEQLTEEALDAVIADAYERGGGANVFAPSLSSTPMSDQQALSLVSMLALEEKHDPDSSVTRGAVHDWLPDPTEHNQRAASRLDLPKATRERDTGLRLAAS